MTIPRHQSILFVVLLVASIVMGVVLWHLRERAHQRLVAGQVSTPTRAPEVAPAEEAILLVASDTDGSLIAQTHSLPLPKDPGSRTRAILSKLLDLYAAPNAAHAVPGGVNSIAQVFLMPALMPTSTGSPSASANSSPMASTSKPLSSLSTSDSSSISSANGSQPSQESESNSPQLAIVNLTGAFVASHPSGLETEILTVLSICGTLHANLPRVTQVRFLVDGQQRATLAGHADLTRTYLTSDAVPMEGTQP